MAQLLKNDVGLQGQQQGLTGIRLLLCRKALQLFRPIQRGFTGSLGASPQTAGSLRQYNVQRKRLSPNRCSQSPPTRQHQEQN